ncbi:hypothetical protein Tco_1003349 [Tanacetum coccineum]|uniref:Reverse transcriptase domain-containing protein n=2 Tax=Tanacetum coccineum TaxID=301880 RepID=A0ABQ5F965_9ASTR
MADIDRWLKCLQAPIEVIEDAIVVPPINANNFELKQPLINLVQSNKFTGRQDPHNHLRFFNKVTSTFRHPEVPNTSVKLLLFPFSLDGEARDLVSQGTPRSIPHMGRPLFQIHNTNTFPPSKTIIIGGILDKIAQSGLAINESKSKVRYSRSSAIDSRKPPTVPKEKKEKKSRKGKQKAKELETISEAVLTEAEQLKIITEKPSSKDDEDDDKNDDDENAQDDEDDDKNDNDENAQDDEDDDKNDDFGEIEECSKMINMKSQTESEDEWYISIHPKLPTPYDKHNTLRGYLKKCDGVDAEGEKLKALEDNFSELKQTNQYAKALSSIPGIVDQYLANKMQEAVDVAVQLKYDRIREEAHTKNQQFLDSIDEGMKKVIKEQVKKEVSKITPKIEKLVNEQLESEVLVWICQILQEISQKRTRERMSDQEAKEIKAEAREIMPQPSTVNCS